MIGNIIVAAIVLLSTAIVARKLYKTLTGKAGCGCSCGDGKNGTSSCCGAGCHACRGYHGYSRLPV